MCENNGEANEAVKLLASESGEVILIPYVFSMMFFQERCPHVVRTARAQEDGRRVTYKQLRRCNYPGARGVPGGAVVRPKAG